MSNDVCLCFVQYVGNHRMDLFNFDYTLCTPENEAKALKHVV